MKYFGTDGVRLIYSQTLVELAYKIGFSLGRNYDRILVATDTRESGVTIARSFISGAIKGGATVSYGGILPTPALAYAVRDGFYKIGAMITASHNPHEYNGIKLFDGEGYKLTEKELVKIENELDEIPFGETSFLSPEISTPKELYIQKIRKVPKPEKDISVLCDCANGATSVTAPVAFRQNGINCEFIGLSGIINSGVGVFFLDKAREIKKQRGLDLAFVFDGDGDRLIAIDEENKILDGDVILFILAKWLKSQNKLPQNIVVGTEYSSLALEESLKSENISLIRTKVGDKYIAEKMRREFLSLGGESSGHIIYNSTTGDGVRTALLLSYLASLSPLCKWRSGYVETQRAEVNFPYSDELWEELSAKTKSILESSNGKGLILLRKSGTEPLVRLLLESADESAFSEWKKLFKIV